MTLTEWIRNTARQWAVYDINVPEKYIFRDTALGPMRNDIPDDIVIAEEEKTLVVKGFLECIRYLKNKV